MIPAAANHVRLSAETMIAIRKHDQIEIGFYQRVDTSSVL
jgi:hypothetical protein